MRLILASQSPSRASILRGAGVEPVLEPADIDERSLETSLAGRPPADIKALAAMLSRLSVFAHQAGPGLAGIDLLLTDLAGLLREHRVLADVPDEQVTHTAAMLLMLVHTLSVERHLAPEDLTVDDVRDTLAAAVRSLLP